MKSSRRSNVRGTERLARLALEAGVKRFVFTSTTALYGAGAAEGESAAWVTEETTPAAANDLSPHQARGGAGAREACRRHRDHVAAHVALLPRARASHGRLPPAPGRRCEGCRRRPRGRACMGRAWISQVRHLGTHAFHPRRCRGATGSRARCLRPPRARPRRCLRRARLAIAQGIDRVYDSSRACADLGWTPRRGFDEVLAELDRDSAEVLPATTKRRAAALTSGVFVATGGVNWPGPDSDRDHEGTGSPPRLRHSCHVHLHGRACGHASRSSGTRT
jgi:hypothetical protein